MSSHTVCFKNLFDCLFDRLPLLMITLAVSALGGAGWGWMYLVFGHFAEGGVRQPIALEVFFYGFFGGLGVVIALFIIFKAIPYLFSEIVSIPRTIKECLRCRG